MDDLLIMEHIELLSEYTVVLCEEDEETTRLKEILCDGSGLDIRQARTPDELSRIRSDKGLWLIIPIQHLEKWDPPVSEKNENNMKVSTSRILLDSIYLNRNNAVFPEGFGEKVNAYFTEEKKQAAIGGFEYASGKMIQDKDIEKFGDKDETAFVYGYAKVGTSTIQASLAALGYPDIDVHTIRGNKILDYLKGLSSVKVFCGVREPISVDFSAFFEGYAALKFHPKVDYKELFKKRRAYYWKLAKSVFEFQPSNYGFMFGWFDSELKDNFGIDIFSQDFDREKGFGIYKNGNIEAFVYKLEKLNSLEGEIGAFLNNPDFKLIKANDASDKYLRYLYSEAKEQLTLKQSYVDFYYLDNERMDYFYTPEEKKEFLKRFRIE